MGGGGAVVASNLEWEGCGDSPLNNSWGGGVGGMGGAEASQAPPPTPPGFAAPE